MVEAVEVLTPADLTVFDPTITDTAGTALISGVFAQAVILFPCIGTLTDPNQVEALKAVLRSAVLRQWAELGSTGGGSSLIVAGPFQLKDGAEASRQTLKGLFLGSELDLLKALCADEGSGGGGRRVFAVDTAPGFTTNGMVALPT